MPATIFVSILAAVFALRSGRFTKRPSQKMARNLARGAVVLLGLAAVAVRGQYGDIDFEGEQKHHDVVPKSTLVFENKVSAITCFSC